MNYVVDHIPRNTPNNRRPGIGMEVSSITIHNTGNPTSTARNERAWLTNPTNNRTASYHLVVDESEIIECLPLHEVGWHAGDGSSPTSGNRTSIGIEICESGNYALAVENAAKLTARLLDERGWGIDRLLDIGTGLVRFALGRCTTTDAGQAGKDLRSKSKTNLPS